MLRGSACTREGGGCVSITIPPHFPTSVNQNTSNLQATVVWHSKGQNLHSLCAISVILNIKFIVKSHPATHWGVGPLTMTWKLCAHTMLVWDNTYREVVQFLTVGLTAGISTTMPMHSRPSWELFYYLLSCATVCHILPTARVSAVWVR